MSGIVVHQPAAGHACNPGWRWEWTAKPLIPGATEGHYYGIPSTSWDYPRGTVWECDKCGRSWVSIGSRWLHIPGDCGWRREGWLARWLRKRRAAASTA